MFDEIYKKVEKNVLLEKLRSKTFNWNQFKKLANMNAMDMATNYAHYHLQVLGQGSSRTVFILSSRYVLKIALPDSGKGGEASPEGIGQNEEEVNAVTSPKLKPIFAEIYDFDKNYRWIVSELVKPAQNGHFFKTYGCTQRFFFKTLRDVLSNKKAPTEEELRYTANYNRENVDKIDYKKLIDTYEGVVAAVASGLSAGDISYHDHWGATADGRIVLLDYGLSEELYKNHYSVG